ncbi:hypothetical protein ACH4ZX_40135 [Streptomyces sp. NPDC020490]|uniref:hypothetical protein n=1 Tax=Streptomyces sp. NPDC020490 TaxID=3365078 RepID=UPI00378D1F5A
MASQNDQPILIGVNNRIRRGAKAAALTISALASISVASVAGTTPAFAGEYDYFPREHVKTAVYGMDCDIVDVSQYDNFRYAECYGRGSWNLVVHCRDPLSNDGLGETLYSPRIDQQTYGYTWAGRPPEQTPCLFGVAYAEIEEFVE